MKAREHTNPVLMKLMCEITPAEMEQMRKRMEEESIKFYEDGAKEYPDVKSLYESYLTLTKQSRWSKDFLEGYLSCIGDLIYAKKTFAYTETKKKVRKKK